MDLRRVAAEARRVLDGNRLRGVSAWEGRRYDFVCPSPSHYPFQWFWDSAFHAIALLHHDPERAKQELRCLLQGLQPDGFIPHMILWEKDAHPKALAEYLIRMAQPFHTATIQPPVLARAAWRVAEATGDAAFAREVLPGIRRFFAWIAEHRDPDDDGLVSIIQPDESGLDCSPKFDRSMGIGADPSLVAEELKRGMHRLFTAYDGSDSRAICAMDVFLWEDVMVNSIYADGHACLAKLSRLAGAPEDAVGHEREAARTRSALMAKCWDDSRGVFWDLSGRAEAPSRVLTFSCLFPLILPELDVGVAARLVEHLLDPREFWLPYPVPSVAASEPSFEPDYRSRAIWRGPSWVNVNWYLYWGLRSHGRADVASELARKTFEMVERGGIREFFNPFTAVPYGAVDFGWTTLVLDLLAAEGELPDSPIASTLTQTR